MGALVGFISDIHRVLWIIADPVDVRNESQQGTRPQAIRSSNFLIWIWGVISISFEKNWYIGEYLITIFHDTWIILQFQGIRALSKVMKKSGKSIYFCCVKENIESILQGADSTPFVTYSTIQDAEQKLRTTCWTKLEW